MSKTKTANGTRDAGRIQFGQIRAGIQKIRRRIAFPFHLFAIRRRTENSTSRKTKTNGSSADTSMVFFSIQRICPFANKIPATWPSKLPGFWRTPECKPTISSSEEDRDRKTRRISHRFRLEFVNRPSSPSLHPSRPSFFFVSPSILIPSRLYVHAKSIRSRNLLWRD